MVYLRVASKANQLANFPLNFLRTGRYYYSDGKVYYRTTDGLWWSATRSSATYANYLGTHTSSVYPQYSNDRGFGFAVGSEGIDKLRYPAPSKANASQSAMLDANFTNPGTQVAPAGSKSSHV